MKMSKLMNRLLIFFIGVPICIALCFFDICKFLPLKIVCLIFGCIGTFEFSNILNKKIKIQNPCFVMILTLLMLISVVLQDYLSFSSEFISLSIFLLIFVSILVEIFSPESGDANFSESIEKIASTLFTLIYTGYFFSFVIKMTCTNWFSDFIAYKPLINSIYITLFLIIVFGTDSFAWFFGMTMGKNNRGFIKASPNKSIAGFVGGIISTIIVVLLITRFVPLFKEYFNHISTFSIVFITFVTSIFAIIGDLFESVLKRCSGVKDSGTIIPGRGGVLDSIDSVILAAPVFYLLVKIF